jgi:hypothetical protein
VNCSEVIKNILQSKLARNNYLFDKKKGNFFFTVFFRVLKRAVFSRVPRVFLTRGQKNSEKSFFFLSNMQFCFMKRLFIRIYFCVATALARPVVAGPVLNFGTKEGTDREADYMCFIPLRRKTSELEGEEYTSRIVSGIDRLNPPLSHVCAPHLSVARPHLGKPESLLICSRKFSPAVSRWRHRSTNIRSM